MTVCRGDTDPDRWVTTPRDDRMNLRVICLRCPDRVDGSCARRALMRDDVTGMWAGVWVPAPGHHWFKDERDRALQRLREMSDPGSRLNSVTQTA